MNRPSSPNVTQAANHTSLLPKSVIDRPVVQQQSTRIAFNQKLEDAERRFQSKSIPSPADRSSSEQWQPGRDLKTTKNASNNGDLDEDDSASDQNLTVVTQQLAPAAVTQGEIVTQADVANLTTLQRAYLDRMAAAIAEIAEHGNQSIFAIEFGADVAIAKSAILGWDKNGALSVRLLTTDVVTSPLAAQYIREQLRERLERRRIAVKSLELLEPAEILPRHQRLEQDDRAA